MELHGVSVRGRHARHFVILGLYPLRQIAERIGNSRAERPDA